KSTAKSPKPSPGGIRKTPSAPPESFSPGMRAIFLKRSKKNGEPGRQSACEGGGEYAFGHFGEVAGVQELQELQNKKIGIVSLRDNAIVA
ncbi:MAG: hypothetical protein QOE88_2712, partial [Verrucomicrobiota bacterium]|nr:hypothetical protein [Verrucomicrobiota bacterium]